MNLTASYLSSLSPQIPLLSRSLVSSNSKQFSLHPRELSYHTQKRESILYLRRFIFSRSIAAMTPLTSTLCVQAPSFIRTCHAVMFVSIFHSFEAGFVGTMSTLLMIKRHLSILIIFLRKRLPHQRYQVH